MASKTVFVLQLLLGICGKRPAKQRRRKNSSNETSRNFHAIEEMLLENQAQ
ncbi:MAG: hypothetical protein ABSF28_17360 [Terracidiphilus sp.]